ncbi:MAG: choline dehydrogenase-like flavoprotein [Halieaceae bacterium]|jgi:choline dehydrogenase-like flavoprotein
MEDTSIIARANDPVDVLVVGSGAAGSLYAAKAAEAGKRVLILEAGPERSLQDLFSSQIWARKLKWGGAHVEEEGNLKIGNAFNSGYGTGGSAMHHYGVWPRLHEGDFSLESDHGVGNNWPLSYENLRPYYDRIQLEVGISGQASTEKWRPKGTDYPLPAMPIFTQGETLARGFAAQGLHTAPIPLAINSRPYKGRNACLFDGWCDAGCPNGALANPLTVYLKQALGAGAQIQHQSTVSRVLTTADNQVSGVEYFDAAGELQTQSATVVVLAAFAVQNARLLLLSKNNKYPLGLGNRAGLVGKYLMTHPSQTINGLFPEPTYPHLGPTGGQLINQDHYDQKQQSNGGLGSYQWLIANAVKPNDLLGFANARVELFGANLDAYMRRAATHFATMVSVQEDIPRAENRIELSKERDQYGLPLAKTIHNVTEVTDKLSELARQEGLAVFKSAGATEAWAGGRAGMHIMGGTIMGESADNSFSNRFGQCHEIENLFVAGSGLFPSSGAVNPTFTIHALSLLSAEYMLDNWSSFNTA